MPIPDRAGRFRAYPVEWTVEEADSGAVSFTCRWRIDQWYGKGDDGSDQWFDFSKQDAEITSWTYFVKKDGSPSEVGVNQLKDALKWDGQDIEFLAVNDWSKTGCSLWTEYEQYQGKTRLKVQWIDAWDSTGGGGYTMKKSDPAKLKSLQGRLGGQLRALSPKSGDDTPPPSGSPASAPPPPPPPAPATSANPPVSEDSIPF